MWQANYSEAVTDNLWQELVEFEGEDERQDLCVFRSCEPLCLLTSLLQTGATQAEGVPCSGAR